MHKFFVAKLCNSHGLLFNSLDHGNVTNEIKYDEHGIIVEDFSFLNECSLEERSRDKNAKQSVSNEADATWASTVVSDQ